MVIAFWILEGSAASPITWTSNSPDSSSAKAVLGLMVEASTTQSQASVMSMPKPFVTTISPSPTLFNVHSGMRRPPAAKKAGFTKAFSIMDCPVPKASAGSGAITVTFLP